MTRVAVVVGSVRPNRIATSIAQWVVDQASAVEGVEAELVDIAAYDLPLFAEELPPMLGAPVNEAGAAFNQALQAFDAVVFVAPEYNYSIPGALKNAIDYLEPRALANKGVGLVGYSYSNGIRAVEHLKQIVTGFGGAVASPQVYLSLNTDVADGAFAPAAYHDGEVPAMVQAVVARSEALASLR